MDDGEERWWGGNPAWGAGWGQVTGSSGVASARERLGAAAASLRGVAPGEWRASAASRFVDRLGELVALQRHAADLADEAARLVSALEAELAAGRASVGAQSPWWVLGPAGEAW